MVFACSREKVCCWAEAVKKIIPTPHVGNILMIHFNSSTL